MFHSTFTSTGKSDTFLSALHLLYDAFHNLCSLPLRAAYIPFLSRGMKFENVQILTDAISDIITDMKWAW